MRVLAGDIGGTKTAVAVVEIGPRRLSSVREEVFASAEFPSLERILEVFLAGVRARPAVAAFGVAGPVREGRAKVTKLPWVIDERRVARSTRIRPVRVLNDFVAAAMGLKYLSPRQVLPLRRGRAEPGGPAALIGAGTGLGQAALFTSSGRLAAVASEGGHADFGPRTEREDRLVRFVRARFGRVSRDRLLSGGGLVLMYDFLEEDGFAPAQARVRDAFHGEDRAAVISRFGLSGEDRLCSEAIRLFVSIYGSEAGNLALQYRATGGLYVGGGIAPRILPALRGPEFLEAFGSKPPMEKLLAKIPVRVVLEPRVGLYGAAAAAYRIAIETTRPSSKSSTRPARR
jgi:glucokinase